MPETTIRTTTETTTGTVAGFKTTQKGRELIAKLLAEQSLTITRVMAGSGLCSSLEEIDALEDLICPVMEGTSDEPRYYKDTCEMTLQFRSDMYNDTVFLLQEYGIFALDPDEGEILMYYATLGEEPQSLTGLKGKYSMVLNFAVVITIGEDLEGVNLGYPASAFLLAEELEEHNKSPTAHETILHPRIQLAIQETPPTESGVFLWIPTTEEEDFSYPFSENEE